MSETSKEVKKNWKLKNGNLGNSKGRPKGSKDKIARSVKKDIEDAFKKLGGVEGLVKWAKKSNSNREKFYQWYFSMLPKNENIDHSGGLDVTINRIITTENPNGIKE